MELLALGIIWIVFLILYSIAFILMRSENVTPENRDFIYRWLFNFRFSFKNPVKTVFLPTLISAGLALWLKDLIMNQGLVVHQLPQVFLLSLFIFVIGEEIIYRGWIIPALLNIRSGWSLGEYAPQTFTDKLSIFLLVILGAGVFALAHQEPMTPFIYGSLMGMFFIGSKRNLVPSLCMHFTANFMVMLFFLGIL